VKGEKLCKLLWFVREMRRGLYRVRKDISCSDIYLV
jgi:hypothetical protein